MKIEELFSFTVFPITDLFRTTTSTQNEKEEIQMIYYDRLV